MLKKMLLFCVLAISLDNAVGMNLYEINKSNLVLPPEINLSKLFYDGKVFIMLFEDENIYIFETESLDDQLRNIDRNKLAYMLGVIWKFKYKDKLLSSLSINQDYLQTLVNLDSIYRTGDPMVDAALLAKPAGAYLQVYKFSDGNYGIHFCPKNYL